MRKKLFHNWGLKLASLVLAVLLWFLVAMAFNGPQQRTFRNIPVELINTELFEQENKVYEILDNTNYVNVSVVAPSNVLSQISESDITVTADVSRLTDISTIPIKVDVDSSNVISASSSREVVRLNVEDKASKYVPLSYATEGEVADGYIVGTVSLDQTMIEIAGPVSAVNDVRSARVNVNVANASSSLSANMEIHLYNQDGDEITKESIRKQTNYVRVSVEVLATKSVPVYVYYSGVPARGYLTTGEIDTDPGLVKVAGTAASLLGVSNITIPGEMIDISHAEEDVITNVDIRGLLPDNVRLADSSFNGNVTVTIHVEPESERRVEISADKLSIINVPDGLEAELTGNADSYFVIIKGLTGSLSELSESAIIGIVDVEAWMEKQEISTLSPGSYYIPVDLQLAEGMEPRTPMTVYVTIRRAG